MASANVISSAIGGALNGSGGAKDPDLVADGHLMPFNGAVQLLQEHINAVSAFIDVYCPISTELLLVLFPFFLGVVRVLWPVVRTSLYELRARRRKFVVRDIVSFAAPVYRTNGLPTDRNALLQNAVLMYLCKSVWVKKPIPASEWRNKASVLLLIDPFRSRVYERNDSPFYIDDDSSSDDDMDLAFAGVTRSAKKIQRLLLVKLPVGKVWVDTQDELGIEMAYKRQRVNIVNVTGVERTLSLRARGPGAAKRLETFTQRCLAYFIAQIPNLDKATRSYYELQPSKVGGLLSSGDDAEATLLFKRYPLNEEKNLDTVFFPEKEQIMKFVDDFLFHRGRFAVEGFPYKLGFLLHGPPGTGKTTFVKALAAYTGRHVISVPLHAVQTNQQLYDIFLNRTFSCVGESDKQTIQLDDVIFLFDDVDAASPLVCSRQRRRAIKRRKPAVLTAREATPDDKKRQRHHRAAAGEAATHGEGGDEEDEFEPTEGDSEEELEDHIVELQERKLRDPTAGLSSFLSSLTASTGPGIVGGSGVGDSKKASTQSLMDLGGTGGARGGNRRAADGTSSAGSGGKLTAFAAGTGDGLATGGSTGFGLDGKKSLFSLFESADKLDLSGLLNVLDGVVDTPGRIVIMITNHPERLDPALVRPGRMSTRLRFDYIQFDALARMAGLHFGDDMPSAESQDVMSIAEKMEEELARDYEAVKAAARYRAQQAAANQQLAAELANDDDVDATTTRTAYNDKENGSGEGEEKASSNKGPDDGASAVATTTTDLGADKPIVIPTGVAAARVRRRMLTGPQVKKLRDCIAALEAEAQAWKRANLGAASTHAPHPTTKQHQQTVNSTSKDNRDGEDPQHQPAAATTATDPLTVPAELAAGDGAKVECPYTFHISPSEVELMCAQTDSLEEFMDMLSQVIRGQLKL